MSTADGLVRRVRDADVTLVLGVMIGLYVLYVVFGLLLGLGVGGIAGTLQQITFLAAVYALVALALNLQWGYAGILNIGVAGFMAVGTYTMAMLTAPTDPGINAIPGLGLPLWVGIVGGMVAAALVGAVAALPALRLRADYLAIVTLALSEIIRLIYNSTQFETVSVSAVRLTGLPGLPTITLLPSITFGTGSASGIQAPPNPINALYYVEPSNPPAGTTGFGGAIFEFFSGIGIDTTTIVNGTYTLVLVLFVAGFYLLLSRVGNSPFGRVLKAIREDELVANSLGKNTQRFKIKTFMLGCALMGLAGILWQGSQARVTPAQFLPIVTFYVFIALIIGGAGSNTGSVIGGALFAGLLFQGPTFVKRIVSTTFSLGSPPTAFSGAVGALGGLDVVPLVAYALDNIAQLRYVLLGIVLVYLMQNRPEGLLGHRKEPAAAVALSRDPDAGTETGSGSQAGRTDGSGETEDHR